ISLGLAGVLTVALLMLARIYIISPLQSVHAAVRELSAGGHSAPIARNRLPLAARDEVGDLARGFVSMAEALERREVAIADQNRQMRLVL
ncbi:HAMP domain-containing protein, partial [Vibrio parahaemolyticus]|uniref:HAMP domain-containing protein n=1 Tax=Vibrio parahaemolyticus TaxID=670 RepID=UPI00211303F3